MWINTVGSEGHLVVKSHITTSSDSSGALSPLCLPATRPSQSRSPHKLLLLQPLDPQDTAQPPSTHTVLFTLSSTEITSSSCWEKKTSVLQRLTSSAVSQWCSTSSRKSNRDFSPVQRWSSFLSASCSRVGMNTLRAQCVSSACQSAEWTPDRWIYCCYRWRHVSLCVDEHLLLTNCDQMRQMDLSRGSALYKELLVTMVMRRGFSPTDLRAVTEIHLISSSLMKWENKLSQIRWRRHRLCSSCEAVSCGPASFPVHMKTTTTVVFTSTQSNDPKQLVARLIGRLFSLCVSVQSWRLSSLSSYSFTEDTLRSFWSSST